MRNYYLFPRPGLFAHDYLYLAYIYIYIFINNLFFFFWGGLIRNIIKKYRPTCSIKKTKNKLVKVKVIPVVVGAGGTIPKALGEISQGDRNIFLSRITTEGRTLRDSKDSAKDIRDLKAMGRSLTWGVTGRKENKIFLSCCANAKH